MNSTTRLGVGALVLALSTPAYTVDDCDVGTRERGCIKKPDTMDAFDESLIAALRSFPDGYGLEDVALSFCQAYEDNGRNGWPDSPAGSALKKINSQGVSHYTSDERSQFMAAMRQLMGSEGLYSKRSENWLDYCKLND